MEDKSIGLTIVATLLTIMTFGCAHRASTTAPSLTSPATTDGEPGVATASSTSSASIEDFEVTTLANGSLFKRSLREDDLLLPENLSFEPSPALTAQQVHDDMSFLTFALKHAYIGRDRVEPIRYREVLLMIQAIREQASLKPFSSKELKEALNQALSPIPDAKLMAWEPGPEDPIEAPSPSEYPKKPWQIIHKTVSRYEIPVVTLHELTNPENKKWDGFVDALKSAWTEAKGIVIDLRGTGGTDETMGRKMASVLLGWNAESPAQIRYASQTPTTFALLANGLRYKIHQLKRRKIEAPQNLTAKYSETLSQHRLASAGKLEPLRETRTPDQPRIPGLAEKPIYILVDRNCASACEATLEFFETYAGTRTFGQNTAGKIQFRNPGQLFLPNSHVAVQIPTSFTQYNDGRFVDKIGYPPTIHVADGKDALEFALADLKGLVRKRR